MKKTRKIIIITFLLCVFIYVCKIDSIPNNVILYNGEELKIGNFLGISLKIGNENCNTILTSSKIENNKDIKNNIVDVTLFGLFKVKEVSINIIEEKTIIPIGQISGLKLYTNGVLVVGLSEITGEDNINYKPYEETEIQEGDRIIKINGEDITDTRHLTSIVNSSKGNSLEIEYVKNNEIKNETIVPIKGNDGTYKIGLWVRDSAAGIGTLTFYEPSTGNFAALGHGITDNDTGDLIEISNGEFLTTKIISITKGLKGTPGRIQGTIENQKTIGTIYKNTNLGIYGIVNNLSAIKIDLTKEMRVARRSEIALGDAIMYCDLDGLGAKEYKIEIEKIFINDDVDNKSMMIKVKDQELLDKTGGIIQGMSGSPIIQNGKFIGCVTNVLVNDSTRGYAVFGDIMIKQMSE